MSSDSYLTSRFFSCTTLNHSCIISASLRDASVNGSKVTHMQVMLAHKPRVSLFNRKEIQNCLTPAAIWMHNICGSTPVLKIENFIVEAPSCRYKFSNRKLIYPFVSKLKQRKSVYRFSRNKVLRIFLH